MFWLAQGIQLIAIGINAISIQFKEKKKILFCFVIQNFLLSINFVLLSAYSGALICLVAAIQTFISYMYERKNKTFPTLLIYLFLVISILGGFISYKTYIDILPIIGSTLYTLSIVQKKEKYIRIFTLFNILVWLIYDLIVGAYTAGVLNVFLVISTIVAIIRYDVIKKDNSVKEKEVANEDN